MNRFKIIKGKEKKFETIWKNRNSYLDNVKGFIKFNLIRGSVYSDYIVYASHSSWDTKIDFENWTKSESFRLAHKDAGKHKDLYVGHPEFEGFQVVV